jgi:ATP-dependent Clp protease adaptor protein ClpS
LFLPAGFSRPVFGLAGFNCRVATYIGCAAAPHASFPHHKSDRRRIAPEAVSRQDSHILDYRGHITILRISMSDPVRPPNFEDDDSGTSVVTKTRPKTKRPAVYRVLLLNDDYTPMEFVVVVLEKFFQKGREEATNIMLHVHQHGVGECGIYTYEIAETKVTQVMDFARKHQHPLQCVMEKK